MTIKSTQHDGAEKSRTQRSRFARAVAEKAHSMLIPLAGGSSAAHPDDIHC